MFLQANTRNMFFDQKSPRHPKVGVLRAGPKLCVLTTLEKPNARYFRDSVMAGQYKAYILWLEITTTPRSGCLFFGGDGFITARFNILQRRKFIFIFFIYLSQINIRNTTFDQRSPWPPEEGILQWHEHTDGHGDSMTDPAQRAKSVELAYKLSNKRLPCLCMTIIEWKEN